MVLTGCVRRRMTVRTNPPGAQVYVDDQEIGITPASTDFIYYGTRKIRIAKDGYETTTVMERMRAPWYQWTPLDYVFENLWPWEIRDERIVDVQLAPKRVVPTQELIGRAENLRQGTRQGVVTPLPQTPNVDGRAFPAGTMVPDGAVAPTQQITQPVTFQPHVR